MKFEYQLTLMRKTVSQINKIYIFISLDKNLNNMNINLERVENYLQFFVQ